MDFEYASSYVFPVLRGRSQLGCKGKLAVKLWAKKRDERERTGQLWKKTSKA